MKRFFTGDAIPLCASGTLTLPYREGTGHLDKTKHTHCVTHPDRSHTAGSCPDTSHPAKSCPNKPLLTGYTQTPLPFPNSLRSPP
jgi:hypothetical protein